MSIEVTTLGPFAVRVEGEEIGLEPGAPATDLLIYLALERETNARSAIDILWPEGSRQRANQKLVDAVVSLRKGCGESAINVSGSKVVAADAVRCDALRFENLVRDEEWESALKIYRGHFLEDHERRASRKEGRSSGKLSSWVSSHHDRLQTFHGKSFRGRIAELEEAGDVEEAASTAREWAEWYPLDEDAHLELI